LGIDRPSIGSQKKHNDPQADIMQRTRRSRNVLIVTLYVAASMPAAAQEKGGLDLTGPYDVVVGWFKPGNTKIARVSRVITTEDERVCVAASQYGRFACHDLNGKERMLKK
jgi:hypothetical protein